MNEVVWALPFVGSVMWSLRPRPPVRRLDPVASTDTRWPPSRRPTSSRPASSRRRRRRSSEAATLPLAQWCEGVARAVRGGDSLRVALEHTPPSPDAAPAVDAIRRHADGRVDDAPTPPDVALVVAVVSACLDHGGPAAEPIDRAAGVLRSRAAERAERRVQSAQARLSATVLTWLPVAMLAVLMITSSPVRRIITTPVGAMAVAVGGALNLVGWWWMRHIVDRASR